MKANLLLGIIGSVTTLVLLFELLRRKHLREKYAILWVLVAILTLFIAAVPQALFWVAEGLGVRVPANLLFFAASMVLLAISIHHSHELGRLEDQSRTLAEELALLKLRFDDQARPNSQMHGALQSGVDASLSQLNGWRR